MSKTVPFRPQSLGCAPARTLAMAAALAACAWSAQAAELVVAENPASIVIDDLAPASAYPSVIAVGSVAPAVISKVVVTLHGFSHANPDDVDILLVAPDGTRSILMSDAGGDVPATDQTLAFSPSATTPVGDQATILAGTFRPANYRSAGAGAVTDTFAEPGPGAQNSAPADLDAFNGIDPNGEWKLYVVDDAQGNTGAIAGGWSLALTVPALFTVTKTADTNDEVCDEDCSLREAIAAADSGDLVRFSPLFDSAQTITLAGSQLLIGRALTIQGPGAELLAISGNSLSRVLRVVGALSVTLSGMTIRDGRVAGNGGGILSSSFLTLLDVVVRDNTATEAGFGGGVALDFQGGNFVGCTYTGNTADGIGGAIHFQGANGAVLRLANTTLSGNAALVGGAGVEVLGLYGSDSVLQVANSTIVDNTATVNGGIEARTVGPGSTATVLVRNSIVADNGTPNTGVIADEQDPGGPATIASEGYNLSNDADATVFDQASDRVAVEPMLGALADNGGHTPTRVPLPGSPAIDAGERSGSDIDQRGNLRPNDRLEIANAAGGDGSDIGAVEEGTGAIPPGTVFMDDFE